MLRRLDELAASGRTRAVAPPRFIAKIIEIHVN